jgi:hypothetical protein
MAHRLSIVASTLAATAKQAWMAAVSSCRTIIIGQEHTYRPEAHYMRGPGPKWREKHARRASAAQ